MALSIQATPNDYWISSNALYIERNAMGNPDYIQASCISDAKILVYVKDVIGFDAGHNYRRWRLEAMPTVFNTHSEKYVYVAIPRDFARTTALLVFPSEEIDIYGNNLYGESVGSAEYYYIFLQGILSSSGDNGTELRRWQQNIATGLLSSDEAIAAGPNESEWYKYSDVDQTATFLKDLTMKEGTEFQRLFADSLVIVEKGSLFFRGQKGEIHGIVNDDTDLNANDRIVVPKFVSDHYLRKDTPDTAQGLISFLQGLTLGKNGNHSIDSAGNAKLGEVVATLLRSVDYNYAEQRGYAIESRNDGKYQLSVTDLVVWGKAVFNTLQLRELSYVGGNIVLSPSASKITFVKEVHNTDGILTGWKCYLLADNGSTATVNSWKIDDQARCQTFNIKPGVYDNVRNKDYWRRVTMVSEDNEVITDEAGNELYDGQKFAWIILSKADCSDGADAEATAANSPAAGDTIVLEGNRTVAARQNLLVMETEGDKAPRIAVYKGVNSYSLANKAIFDAGYDGVNIVSHSLNFVTPDGTNTQAPLYRGTWQEGTAYAYYDEVTWMGTRWLCIASEGTVSEPYDGNDLWRATTAVLKLQLVLQHDLGAGIARGETHTVRCLLMLGDTDCSSAVTMWEATRNTGDKTLDEAWALQDKVRNFHGSLDITWSNDGSVDDLGTGDLATFIFRAKTTTGEIYKQILEI